MARQDIQIQINTAVESAQSAQSLGQLRRALIDIQNLQSEIGDASSEEFGRLQTAAQQTTARLAGTREAIGDIQDRVRTLDGSPVERMTNSFQLMREAIFNLDLEKLKVGFDGIKTALLSNPMFLIAGAIAAAAAAVATILASLGLLYPLLDNISETMGAVVQGFKDLADAIGFTRNAELEYEAASREAYEKRVKQIDDEAERRKKLLELRQYLSSEEIRIAEKQLGIELGMARTAAQVQVDRTKQQIAEREKLIERLAFREASLIERGFKLSKEDVDAREKAWTSLHELKLQLMEEETIAQAEANRTRKELDNQLYSLIIGNMTNVRARRRAEIELERQEALDKIDESIKNLQADNKEYQKAQRLRAEINESFNRQIAEANKEFRKEDVAALQESMNNHYRVLILMTEANTQERLVIEKEYRDKQLEFMRRHQYELGLSNDQIKAAELTFANEIEGIHQSMYNDLKSKAAADLREWETNEDIKILKTKEGSVGRLQAEQKFLEDKLVYYAENYKALGIAETEYQKIRLQLQNEYSAKTSEIDVRFRQSASEKIGLISRDEADRAYNVYANLYKKLGKDVEDFPPKSFFDGILRGQELTRNFTEDVSIFGAAITALQGSVGEDVKAMEFSLIGLGTQLDFLKTGIEESLTELPAQKLLGDLELAFARLDTDRGKRRNDELAANKAYYDALKQMATDEFELKLQQNELAYLDFVSQSQKIYEQKLADNQLDLLLGESTAEEAAATEAIIRDNFRLQMAEHERLHQEGLTNMYAEFSNQRLGIVKQEVDAEKKLRDEARNNFFDRTSKTMQGLQNFTDNYFKTRLNMVKGNAAEEKKIAKQQFEVQKAFQIGLAVINGVQSILAITSVPDFTLGVASAIRIAAQLALNAASIAAIATTQFDAGGSATTPNITAPSGGGVGGGGGTIGAPEMPIIPQTFNPAQFFGLGEMQLAGPNRPAPPQRVYVLETDITETQSRVSVIEQRAQLQ